MSRTEQELRELYRSTHGMPSGAAKFAALEEVIRHADALGLVEFAFDVRMSATSTFQHSWAAAKAFLTFSWCLAAYDREPERFGAGHEHSLLWHFKWMVYSVYQFPEIPLQRTMDLLDDMERRYRRGGHSLHAVLQHRGLLAESIGELDQAQDFYERMTLSKRDGLSDCSGCVPSSHVRTLVALGRDEEAIRVGEPAIRSGCTEQPQWIYSELLLPFVRSGLGERAVEAHRTAYRRIRDNPHHLGELALNLLFCVRSGNLGRGLDLIERHLSWLDRPRTPLMEMEFAAAAVAVLSRAREQDGGDGTVLRFPTVEGKRRPDARVADLAVELRERALAIAERFDARNGNTYQSTRIRDWMGTGPIGEPTPLSVFERDLGTRSGERLQRLVDQVAAQTAAGDLTAAARSRVATAEVLLAEEQYSEAAEAAEEAVRELDRLGLTADLAACRWLLARAYREGGQRQSATGVLRELLDSDPWARDPWAREPREGSPAVALPPRPELETALGESLGYGPEAAARYLAAARGFEAAGRTEDSVAALGAALTRHPRADGEPVEGLLADLLAEADAALGRLLGEVPPARPVGPAVEATVDTVLASARHLHSSGRFEDAADRLRTGCALLDAHPDAVAASRRGDLLTELGAVHLRLGDPAAAEEAARAALELLEDPDYAWDEVVVLAKALRALGKDEEFSELMADHGLDEGDLDD
ncbi:hypothetical protein [Streptomyces sp. FH025]|uniref:hypothetical protein n=1 Tax=Streptomyces sp. FH025 TaxID=2815937 RepID=UPI001A9F65A6|nr:hypothetical protein [Streptomyces sp. FH025]MBO1418248.1 hypothetical protein [Streptomyces sp. FH025]